MPLNKETNEENTGPINIPKQCIYHQCKNSLSGLKSDYRDHRKVDKDSSIKVCDFNSGMIILVNQWTAIAYSSLFRQHYWCLFRQQILFKHILLNMIDKDLVLRRFFFFFCFCFISLFIFMNEMLQLWSKLFRNCLKSLILYSKSTCTHTHIVFMCV